MSLSSANVLWIEIFIQNHLNCNKNNNFNEINYIYKLQNYFIEILKLMELNTPLELVKNSSIIVGNLAQFSQQSSHLKQCVHAIDDLHMSLTNFLDEGQSHHFVDRNSLGNAKYIPNDIFGCVAQPP